MFEFQRVSKTRRAETYEILRQQKPTELKGKAHHAHYLGRVILQYGAFNNYAHLILRESIGQAGMAQLLREIGAQLANPGKGKLGDYQISVLVTDEELPWLKGRGNV